MPASSPIETLEFSVDKPDAAVDELRKHVFLRPTQRQEVNDSIGQLEELLRKEEELSVHHGISIGRNDVLECLRRDRTMLDDGTPPDLKAGQKNKLFALAQRLRDTIAYDMPTIDDMERPLPANIDKHMAWERLHKRKILAYRAIMRVLDPYNDGPNFASVEAFRTTTPPKGDPRRFSKGWDQIAWKKVQEAELSAEITDDDYLRFLERKCMNWTQVTICKDLQWNKAQFETATQRFRDAMELMQDDDVAEPPPADDAQQAALDTQAHGLQKVTDTLAALTATRDLRARAEAICAGPRGEWPQAELAQRQLHRNWLASRLGMERARLYSLMNPNQHVRWKLDEALHVLEVLQQWDEEHGREEDVEKPSDTEKSDA